MESGIETRIWLITGDPGSGKTIAVSKILLQVRSEGYTVGGILTREIRSRGEREGFMIVDVSSDESSTLATTKRIPGPRVGKYHVDIKVLSELASKAFEHARNSSDLVVCDEVGPMELYSPEFRKGLQRSILDSEKPSLCVLHKRLADPLIEQLKTNERSKIFEVTYENREGVPNEISREILKFLNSGKGRVTSI